MKPAGALVALGLVAAAWAVAAFPHEPGPAVHIHPGEGHDAAVNDGWLTAEFSDTALDLQVRSSPGAVTQYGAVFSVMNHGEAPVWFCLAGARAQAGPVWTLHGDGLHWQSDQAGATLVMLGPREERQVEVSLDWRDEAPTAGAVGWSIVPYGHDGCRLP